MNQFFSFRRFQLLVLKHWADNKKRYGLSVLAFTGLLIAWFVFTILVQLDQPMSPGVQEITFFFCLFAAGAFYASQFYRDLGSRAKGANFLLVPASTFEKLLCGLLFGIVFFFMVFLAAFYIADVIMVMLYNGLAAKDPNTQTQVINIFSASVVNGDDDATVNIFLFFLAIQSAFLLGSVFFGKYSLLKTIIAGFVIWFLVFCLFYFFYEHLLPDGHYINGFFTSFQVHVDGPRDHLVEIPHWTGLVLLYVLLYAVAPFLWLVTYYRLKEKQV